MIAYLLGGAAVYGLVVGGLYLAQDGMLFPREAARHPTLPLPEGAERLRLATPEGPAIVGHLLRARRGSRGLMLGFPGNAWNAQDCLAWLAQRLPDFDLVVFHYRGYHPSEGEPSERALFADAELIYDVAIKGLEPERTYAFGASLGSGVASYLARVRPLDGLVLVTPFDSVEAIARSRYFFAPVRLLLRHPFRSDLHLQGRDVPVAVIAAGLDRVVPWERTQALVQKLRRPVLVETIPGVSHGGIYDSPLMDRALRRALAALERAHEPFEGGDVVTL